MSISYEGGVQAGDDFLLGSVVSQSVKIELLTDADLYETQTVTFKIGLKTDSTTTEWVPFSTFYIDSIKETQEGTVSLTCYDAIIKSEVEFTGTGYTTLAQVATKITAQTGIAFADTIPSTAVSTLSTGATVRTVLGYIASYMGGFMVINRSNQYKVVKPLSASVASVTTDNYFTASVEKSSFQVGKFTCIISTDSSGNDTKLSSGTLTTTTKEVQFENPWMTQAQLNSIKTSYAIFTYTGMEVELQGNPALDSCDIVTLTHKNGMTYAIPVLYQKITFNGGIKQTITCKGITTLKNSFSSEGDSAKALEKVQAQQGIFNSLVTESLSADDGTFINVSSKFAEIETAYIKTAEIDTALIGSATITNLDTEVANINTLISGSTVSGSTQTIVLNAVNSTFDSAYFRSLVSENVVASDILAGHINTNDITISDGPDTTGNFVISSKTLQIKDGTRVRVQLGEDASADYNLYIWDASGNLMFDATGLKESGVQTAIIKDSMVKSDANIAGSKLNISSVVTAINGGTTKISASTVYLDTQAQTLQVAFGNLITVIGDTSSFTTNQTTIAATVNGLSSTVSSQAQSLSSLSSQYSTLSQDYSGFKVTVGNTYATIDSLGDYATIAAMTSAISQSADSINLSVSQTYATLTSVSDIREEAESKARTFITTPTAPYDLGDLWNSGNKLYICATPKTDAQTYSADDWVLTADKTSENTSADTSAVNGTAASTITGDISDLKSEYASVSQEITASAIVTKVNTALAGTSQISTTSFTMDKAGFTVNNGALTIKNNAGTSVFTANTSGNILLSSATLSSITVNTATINNATFIGGKITQNCESGNVGLTIQNGMLSIYSYRDAGNLVGKIFSDPTIAVGGLQAMHIGHDSGDAMYIGTLGTALGAEVVNPIAISITGSSSPSNFYNTVGVQSIRDLSLSSSAGDIVLSPSGRVLIKSNGGNQSAKNIQSWGATIAFGKAGSTSSDPLCKSIYDTSAHFYWLGCGTEGIRLGWSDNSWTGGITSWHVDCSPNGNTYIGGNLQVYGAKTRVVNTDYGRATLQAYETTESLFGEVGQGEISEDGSIRIYISEVFKETITARLAYHVFLTSYSSAQVYCSERTEDYFIINGTPGTQFSFEIKAKQRGYERPGIQLDCTRWNRDDPTDIDFAHIDYDAAAAVDDLLQTLTDEQDNLIYE